jgi:hypothetical protein
MSWYRAHSRTCDQILLPVWRLLSESCCLVHVGLLLWREDGSAVCSVITQWFESRRTRTRILLSHQVRLTQPGGPGPHIYNTQRQGGTIIPPATGFPLRHLLRLARLRWRYSNPPEVKLYYDRWSVGQSVLVSGAPFGFTTNLFLLPLIIFR